MTYERFFERTHVEVDANEFHVIVDAYCDFDGNEDEFCEWWLEAYENGYWARESKIRKEWEEDHGSLQNYIDMLTEENDRQRDKIYNFITEKHKFNELAGKRLDRILELEDKLQEYNKIMDALSVLKNAIE